MSSTIDIGGTSIDLSTLGNDQIAAAINAGDVALQNSIAQAVVGNPSSVDPVPTQNLILQTVLAPVSAALQNAGIVNSVPALQTLGQFLSAQQAQWMTFARKYPSSRMTGAINTLAPYWTNLGNAIANDIVKLGGTPTTVPGLPGVTIPGNILSNLFGSTSTTTLLLAGLAIWFVMRGRD